MIKRLFSTETLARTNARRSLRLMQQRRQQTEEAQVALDTAAARTAGPATAVDVAGLEPATSRV